MTALTRLLLSALVTTVPVHAQLAPVQGATAPVRTADGMVAGTTATAGVRMFRGIPFAAPPVRALRWMPPQPARPWSGVRLADRFAAQCMQSRVFSDMVFRNDGVSEDCLYLNVWAPSSATRELLPVLVYFYGGGFRAGDGSEPRYDGESMARQGIVVVTTSYRLGVFGFFSHPELTRESPRHASGNYALMDQTAALRWVRRNISAFGGDPRRVTIAGESAGSFSVSAQMASSLARGLFAGAIGESGAFFSGTIPTPTLAETEQRGVQFGQSLGASSLAQLRALSALELLDASSRPDAVRFGPNVDGEFLVAAPETVFAAGGQAHVPLLAGWNSEEAAAGPTITQSPTPENMAALMRTTFGESSAQAAQVYPAATAAEVLKSATDLASDRFIAYSTWKWLEEQSRTGGVPVYRYLFARPRPPALHATQESTVPRGAVHSAEIEYALGNLASNRVYAWTPEDYRLSVTMQRYFANFVKSGQPNGAGLPNWPVGSVGRDGAVLRMRLDTVSGAEREPRARYLFLDRFYTQTRR